MFTKKNSKNLSFFLISVFIILSCCIYFYLFYWPVGSSHKQDQIDFFVEWGEPFISVAERLEEQGIVKSAKNLVLTAKLTGKTQKIRAGMFSLALNSSNYHVLNALIKGPQSYIRVTIPEGVDSRKIASLLKQNLNTDSLKFMELVNDTIFIKNFGIQASSLEGYLYPETYNFPYGTKEQQVINELLQQFYKNMHDSLIERGKLYNFDLNQILTLASIIEGEAIIDSEMATISSVYHNRLKAGMLLQADPTIQYIIPNGPRRLLNKDLKIDSPYNTYKYPGLPPGPINNPGYKAIYAAVHPAPDQFYYMVADGKGGHIFSRSLREHINAKKKFDRIRIQVAREKRLKGLNNSEK